MRIILEADLGQQVHLVELILLIVNNTEHHTLEHTESLFEMRNNVQ